MNKQDWTYKTFGEVGSFLRGKSIQKADFIENGFPCIHYGQIHTKFGVSVDKHLSEIPLELYNKSIIASHGDVIIAITSEDLEGSCKSTAWLGDYDVAVSSHAAVYKHNINPKFIAYYLRSKSFYYEKMKYARGFKVVEIKPTAIERIPIPVPPIAEQERIVAELDLLQGIIEKKKEQLKAYDQLAQSIFYTMFGDPIDNPKGWETKKLKEVSTLINGRAYKQNELLSEGKYKVLRVGNFFTNSNFYYSDLELEDNKYCDNGDLLFAWSASFGAFIWNGGKVIFHYHIWKVLYDEQQLNKIFYRFLLNTMTNAFMNDVHGIGMVHLTKQGMEEYNIPIPPLSLQQEFAEKVEAIERQKALVQQSIEETQTMFDYTMDKYFG